MNVYIKFWFLFFGFSLAQAQLNEIGFFGGGNSFMGDIGEEKFYTPEGWYGSVYYSRNLNPWMSFRLGGMYSKLHLDDARAVSAGRNNRNWQADISTLQINLFFEYNFLPLNPYKRPKTLISTPYLATGITGFQNTTQTLLGNTGNIAVSQMYFSIPMVFGIKFSVSRNIKFHWEFAAYYHLSDNMDGSHTADTFPVPLTNRNSNDWYLTSGVGISFGFGKMPCYINVF